MASHPTRPRRKFTRTAGLLALLPTTLAARAQSLPADTLRLSPAVAIHPPADSLVVPRCRLSRVWHCPAVRMALPPVAFITAGALTTRKVGMLDTDEELRDELQEHVPEPNTRIDDQLRYVPAYASLGLSVLGVKGKHSTIGQGVLMGMSYIVTNTIVTQLKNATQVERPDGSNYHSFPSQHTAMAFATATLLHKEYGHRSIWYSVAGYSVATGVATLRLVKNNHWLSDVMAGAGVGIASTHLVYLTYPLLERAVQKILPRRQPATATRTLILPYYAAGTVGASIVLVR
ncbi:phosphatase PAP2 family protein [Hymenobacter sp. ASUV-10]|uniref:Phosphatase PAP2 family protein n=1 Tax=Hymenobacter aranciens TaxID=3063996 RepID=A0ABT9BBZ6_9BACT|nr:phosphatase PAP2 family protein [Hymenobacter sp. ASUV-10]MDO7875795.1 phosphatase PAP2 family protein [Hymenobacter sp. ASUV-10]